MIVLLLPQREGEILEQNPHSSVSFQPTVSRGLFGHRIVQRIRTPWASFWLESDGQSERNANQVLWGWGWKFVHEMKCVINLISWENQGKDKKNTRKYMSMVCEEGQDKTRQCLFSQDNCAYCYTSTEKTIYLWGRIFCFWSFYSGGKYSAEFGNASFAIVILFSTCQNACQCVNLDSDQGSPK